MKQFVEALRPLIVERSFLPSRCTQIVHSRHASFIPRPQIASILAKGSSLAIQSSNTTPNHDTTVTGFVRSIRRQKRVAFAAIGDGSSLEPLQAVMTPQQAEGLSTGTAVTITGQWTPSPSGKQQAYELRAHKVRIVGENDAATYPIQKKYHSSEFLRTLPHLRPRLPFNSLLLRLRSQLIGHVTTFFADKGFVQTHPPLITSSDCEGAGEVFSISPASSEARPRASQAEPDHFFGSPKYLTVSSQLHLESLAQSVGSVWALSPTFRAERSDTPRHLNEFYMLEAEIAFCEDVNEIMDVVEDLLRFVTRQLKHSRIGDELLLARSSEEDKGGNDVQISSELLGARWQALLQDKWPRISYHQAVDFLRDAEKNGKVTFDFRTSPGSGLQAEHEKYLTGKGGFHGPVFVTDYPKNMKPFYMLPSKADASDTSETPTVACFDLLLPEVCEVVGGSLREHRLQELIRSMQEHGMQAASDGVEHIEGSALARQATSAAQNSLRWYVDLRRYGSVPHGGFGLGFDRFICYLSGITNIRDTVPFPRWYKRCDC